MLTKVILITNNKNLITGYQTSPIEESDKTYLVDLDKIHLGFSYVDSNDNVVYNDEIYNTYLKNKLKEKELNKKRIKRKQLLEAFDKWEKAVLRGREEDDDSIMLWYYDLLDLKESAFENVPTAIQYYIY